MSRSYKKPYVGVEAGNMTWWKKMANRQLRRKKEEDIPDGSYHKKEEDRWTSPGENKHYWNDPRARRK